MNQSYLKSKLDYDKDTGIFTWKIRVKGLPKHKKYAGSYEKNRYLQIGIDGKLYYGHRLAWLYVYGEFPSKEIDHINGDKHDNRIENLRDVSSFINGHNRRSANKNNKSTGLIGAYFDKRDKRYFSTITINRKNICLGTFDNAKKANLAYLHESKKLQTNGAC